jgi:putative hydrolase of the HAD superfamily
LIPIQEMLRAYDESVGWLQQTWERNEELSAPEQIRFIVKNASNDTMAPPEEAMEQLQEAYDAPLLSIPPNLREGAISTLQDMRRRARKMGLISNTGRSAGKVLRQLMAKFGIIKFFDATIFSDEIGWRKPNSKIFRAAAEALQVECNRIIHIGDNPEADVWGAKQAGMRAILLETEIPAELEKLPYSLVYYRGVRRVSDSEIKPDCRIRSLKESLEFVGSI